MPNRPRGTRDFGPSEMAARQWALQRMQEVFRRFGYHEVQTPTFEELELFTAKSGDGIISELYDFEDKGGRRLTLRPELTAPVMRFYFADHAFDPKPVKWFYFGPCFRYDRPQKGRYREFWQIGCEQIGAGTPLAYAELIALADRCFDAVALSDRDMRVGHVGVLGALVDAIGLDADARGALMRAIDKKDMDAAQQASPELLAALAATNIDEARAAIGDSPRLDELEACLGHLERLGVNATLDLGIARGLDYYTGIVFECHAHSLEAQSQILGGGGYDLSQVFGGQPTPTMGFGLGFDRTLVALESAGAELPGPRGPFLYVGALGDAATAWAAEKVAALRDDGVAVELDLLGRKPGQVAKAADAVGADHLIIVGERDLEAGAARIKHLATGEQTDVALADLRHWVLQQNGGDPRDLN